jgi:DNA-binding IclR family transcriptional regulator
MTEKKGGGRIQSVQTACNIIEFLKENNGAGITEMAREFDLTKGTIHHHLSTLKQNEFVIQEDGTYYLSLRYLEFGEFAKRRLDFFDPVRSEANRLAEETGELVHCATEEFGRTVIVYKVGGENSVQTASYVGKRDYMHTVALGKVMLANMSRDRTREIIDRHGLPQQSEHSITDEHTLFEELETVKDRGYALNLEESHEGLCAIAAPIKNHETENVLGAISLTGPASRFKGELLDEELPRKILDVANELDVHITYA